VISSGFRALQSSSPSPKERRMISTRGRSSWGVTDHDGPKGRSKARTPQSPARLFQYSSQTTGSCISRGGLRAERRRTTRGCCGSVRGSGAKYGLKTVLCAGNGMLPEPLALGEAGFHVTALDLSPVAMRLAKIGPAQSSIFCDPRLFRLGGHADFVAGTLLRVGLVCGINVA
jgi:hypothetical protein